MPDPREHIPDVIHVAADGTRWLIRAPQLLVMASRNQPPTVVVDFRAHACADVVEGIARIVPGDGIHASRAYGLADLPPELAVAIAEWMASEARASGLPLLLPVIDPQGTTDDP
jgi:hypothetical protein